MIPLNGSNLIYQTKNFLWKFGEFSDVSSIMCAVPQGPIIDPVLFLIKVNDMPMAFTVWKVSKYGVFSGSYFPLFGLNTEVYSVFSLNTRKYGPEKTLYLDTFHAVNLSLRELKFPTIAPLHK